MLILFTTQCRSTNNSLILQAYDLLPFALELCLGLSPFIIVSQIGALALHNTYNYSFHFSHLNTLVKLNKLPLKPCVFKCKLLVILNKQFL